MTSDSVLTVNLFSLWFLWPHDPTPPWLSSLGGESVGASAAVRFMAIGFGPWSWFSGVGAR